jgi:ankyrin repeat protein
MAVQPSDDDINGALNARDVAGLIRLLDAGLDPDWRGARGNSLLHEAARLGDISLIGRVLEKGAKAFVLNDEGETPWDMAVIWGNDDAAKLLAPRIAEDKLARGTEAIPYQSLQEIRDKTAETGINQLHHLAQQGQFARVILLAVSDPQGLTSAELLSKGLDGDTVLMKVCQKGQLPQLAKPELWVKKPQEFQKLWENIPAHYRKEVNYDSFISQVRQARLQSYGKLKLKGFGK